MRVCVLLVALMLVVSHGLCGAHKQTSMDSNIRIPDIDASWYTGRGIRPVGRFGRRAKGRSRRRSFRNRDGWLAQ
ncbi:unnamed protein product [Merluccius merluccius]